MGSSLEWNNNAAMATPPTSGLPLSNKDNYKIQCKNWKKLSSELVCPPWIKISTLVENESNFIHNKP